MKDKTVRGVFWTLVDTAGGQALNFIAFLVLARLLAPADYGLVAMAMAAIAIPGILLNEGFGDSLVQREGLTDEHINVVFWVNLGLSLIFVALVMACSGLIASLAGEPQVAPVIRWMSLTLVATGMGSVAGAIYRRRIDYSRFALRTLVATVSGVVTGVGLAVLGFGVWSLVASQLVQGFVGLAVMWYELGWYPGLRFSVKAFRDIGHFSSYVMLGNVFRFATEKLDSVIIGSALGANLLGFYYMAQRLLMTINYVSISPVDAVMLPSLSRMQDDPKKLADTYVTMIWAAAILWVPSTLGLGLVAPRLVPLLFGPKWDFAVPVIMIVSITAVTQVLMRATSQVLIAVGRPLTNALINAIHLVIMVLMMLVGVRYGINGAAWAFTLTTFAIVPFHLAAIHRVVGVRVGNMMLKYSSVLAAGAVMGGAVYEIGVVAGPAMGDWTLLVQIACGAAVYAVALYCFAASHLRELLSTVFSGFQPSRMVPARLMRQISRLRGAT